MSISYLGNIKHIDGDTITVAVEVDHKACSSCQVKSACGIGQEEGKLIEVEQEGHDWHVGDRVRICAEQATRNKAVFWAYLLPFLMLVGTVVLSFLLFRNDGITALLSLCTIVIYYVILYRLRERFKRTLSFRLEHV